MKWGRRSHKRSLQLDRYTCRKLRYLPLKGGAQAASGRRSWHEERRCEASAMLASLCEASRVGGLFGAAIDPHPNPPAFSRAIADGTFHERSCNRRRTTALMLRSAQPSRLAWLCASRSRGPSHAAASAGGRPHPSRRIHASQRTCMDAPQMRAARGIRRSRRHM